MEKKSGVWFWVLLAIIIFVLYCLTMQRPYCQTLDEMRIHEAAMEAAMSPIETPHPVDRPSDSYKTPTLFNTDTIGQALRRQSTSGPSDRSEASATPSWIPKDTLQPILRPDAGVPEPFGYSLFANQDRLPSDPYASLVPEEYQLGTGDHLHVALWGRVDQEFELVIDRSGRVFIPKAGQVMLAGMTVAEAEKTITSRLQTIYSDFDLAVTLGQLRTFRVYVFGEVRRPGAYTVGAAATLVDALYQAGGPSERGTLRRVRLVRGDNTSYVDLYDFLLSGRRTSDPRLATGDVIFVDIAGPRAVARGRVKRPGIYELHGPTTLREFIQLAGGFEADAYRDRVMIDRLQDTDGRQLLDVNLSADCEPVTSSEPSPGRSMTGTVAAAGLEPEKEHQPASDSRPADTDEANTFEPHVYCDAPPVFHSGKPFDLTVGLKNLTSVYAEQAVFLDISFPENPALVVIDAPGWRDGQRIWNPGDVISHAPDTHRSRWHQSPAEHRLVSLARQSVAPDGSCAVTLRVIPQPGTTTLTVLYRGTIGERCLPETGPTDQQNLCVAVQKVSLPYTISGTVTVQDSPDQPLASTVVYAEPGGLSATTDARGFYRIVDVPADTYTLTVAADGLPAARTVTVGPDASNQNFAVARQETTPTNVAAKSPGWDTPVLDGDDISVFSMFEARPNLVWLDGWVKHPGAFERAEGMTIGELIDWGEQLKPGAYLERADLIRPGPDGRMRLVAVDLEAVIDDMEDASLVLQDGDRLTVYARDDVEPHRMVTIDGEVRRPGEYHLYEAMRLSDLVFQAGNATRRALTEAIEVVRKNPDGTTHTMQCNLRSVLERGDLAEDIVLREGDYVFVRPDPRVGAHRLVYLEGEVRFPGRYALIHEDDSFYNVLQRAGGLTPQAFPEGTIFSRQEISKDMERLNYTQILQNSQPLLRDSTGHVFREELLEVNPESMTRLVIDVPQILRDKGGENDIIMRPGDRVMVPTVPSGVQVLGTVAAPGTISHRKNWRINDYISRAGGMTQSSDKDGVRVVKANGQVVECGGKNRRIELGDAVFVPAQIKKSSDWLKTLTQTVSIIGGVATTVLVVQSLGN